VIDHPCSHLTAQGQAGGIVAGVVDAGEQARIAALVEICAGLSLLFGWQVRWASLALFVFLIPATLVFHAAPFG
jgi:uncharacterized membrane protein YphA (DoxX/SURF4 family)